MHGWQNTDYRSSGMWHVKWCKRNDSGPAYTKQPQQMGDTLDLFYTVRKINGEFKVL